MILLNGKETADAVKKEIAAQVAGMTSRGERPPHLVAVLVGEDGASKTYVANKEKACAAVGFKSTLLTFPESVTEAELLAQIQKDKSKFEELAIAMSDCPSGKQAKGSLGSFRRGAMVKAFEDAAFALKEGELSGVVETEFGYHIIRRDARQEAKAIPFEEVKENLINFLKRQKLEEANLAYMEQLLKDNKVEFLVQAPALQLPEK